MSAEIFQSGHTQDTYGGGNATIDIKESKNKEL